MNDTSEESSILDAIEHDELDLRTPTSEDIQQVKKIAKNSLTKNKSITIRLYEHDYTGIQKKAMELGMPYQTLISSLIHRYIEGELK